MSAALTQCRHTHSPSTVSWQGMKVSCTHFQCSAGAFSYLRDHFSHNFSVDMSHQILSLNINLMLVRDMRTHTHTHRGTSKTPAPPAAGPGPGVSPGEVDVGQQEEFPGGAHQRPGWCLAGTRLPFSIHSSRLMCVCVRCYRWWITTKRPADLWRTRRQPRCWGRFRKTGRNWSRWRSTTLQPSHMWVCRAGHHLEVNVR